MEDDGKSLKSEYTRCEYTVLGYMDQWSDSVQGIFIW